jgi:cell division septum initiation protein DivIVA
MDLASKLQQLEQLVLEAKSMPLSSSVLVNRDEVLEMVGEMQESLPEEIKQARWIVKDREDLLGKARAEGERLVEQANEEQRRMALKEEVARRADAEAQSILEDAQDRADAMRREAEDYVDAKLAQFEIALRKILEDTQGTARSVAKTLDQVEVGRERLRTPATAAEQALGSHPHPADAVTPTDLYDDQDAAEGSARGAATAEGS